MSNGTPLGLSNYCWLQVRVSPRLAQHGSKEAYGLHSLAQAHVIRQDAPLVLGVLPE